MSRWAEFWQRLTLGLSMMAIAVAGFLTAACSPAADQVFPTARPTATVTPLPSQTATISPTVTPTPLATAEGGTGPEPTSPIGVIPTQPPPTLTPVAAVVTGDAEIEYFT